jgi:4-hydroxybenzoate polyprenyltransferase
VSNKVLTKLNSRGTIPDPTGRLDARVHPNEKPAIAKTGEPFQGLVQSEDIESRSIGPPLVVDLDGTLLQTDLLHESVLRLIKQKPWTIILLPFWLLCGRAYLKRKIVECSHLDYRSLPVHEELLAWLLSEKRSGRWLVLATASDQRLAELTVQRLNLFDAVLGSDGKRNLKGRQKLDAIIQVCGSEFDYAGNSRADQPLWEASRQAIVVNASKSVEAAARRSANVTHVFKPSGNQFRAAVRSLRLYQWVKNLLVFVPGFTSHQLTNANTLATLSGTFLAFGLCASGAYVVNDLFDLEEDRCHSAKRDRPFASGRCSIPIGVALAALCIALGLGIAAVIGNGLIVLLTVYICLTVFYSLYLKKILLVDVLTLAVLYTMRVIAGHMVTGIPFSVWLSSFVFFLFLSLAFSKRAAELVTFRSGGWELVPGRGYEAIDLGVITTAGIASGLLSSLVLALYINSDAVRLLYRRPAMLWAILPVLLYYILRIWVIAGRGQLDADPIIYTVKSPSTYYAAGMILMVVIGATTKYL